MKISEDLDYKGCGFCMFSWSYLFSDEVLSRGISYYDRVHSVRRLDNKVFGLVDGSDSYFVCVTLKDDNVLSLDCNCYYNAHCKHEVAFLNYIDKHDDLFSDDNQDNLVTKINNMDENSLRSILLSLLDDDKYTDMISQLLSESSFDEKELTFRLKNILKKL